jgi:hypothetical protein
MTEKSHYVITKVRKMAAENSQSQSKSEQCGNRYHRRRRCSSSSASLVLPVGVVLMGILFPTQSWCVGAENNNYTRGDIDLAGECIPSATDLLSFHCKRSRNGNSNNGEMLEGVPCIDEEPQCSTWASTGECRNNPRYMLQQCRKSCNSCLPLHVGKIQVAPDDDTRNAVHQKLLETQWYLHNAIDPHVDYLKTCYNQHEMCTYWAVKGQCSNNVELQLQCAPACQSCHKIEQS